MTENVDIHQPVGNMPMGALLSAFEGLLNKTMEGFAATLDKTIHEVGQLRKENNELRAEVVELKCQMCDDKNRIEWLEQQARKLNLIIRGLPNSVNPNAEVQKLLKDTLKISGGVDIQSVKKLYDEGNNMTVILELADANSVANILKSTRNLSKTKISIEKDLTKGGRERRAAMAQLRKEILQTDKNKLITLRGDQLKIENKYFYWKSGELMCENKNGKNELSEMYKNNFEKVNFSFKDLIDKYKQQANRRK